MCLLVERLWSPEPEVSFREAESLRLLYTKNASQRALAKYRDALESWARRGNDRDAARAAQQIAGVYEQLGDLKASTQSYAQALSLSQKSHDPLLEADIQSDVGVSHARLGEFDPASAHCNEALHLAQQLRGLRETARALNCLGEVDYHRGNSQGALGFYRRAEQLWNDLGDRRGRAETLRFLGSAHSDLNELDAAGRYLKLSLSLSSQLGDKRGQALTDLALARLRYFPGEYQEALNRLTSLRDQFQAAGDIVWEAACLSSVAYIYEQMGESRTALRYWETASGLFEASGLQMAALETFVKIGTSYLATDVATSLNWFERALRFSEASATSTCSPGLFDSSAWPIWRGAIPRRHSAISERSLSIQASIDDPRFRARTLADVGRTHDLLGDHQRAIAYFKQALRLTRSSGDRAGEATALFGLARTSGNVTELDAARAYIESALRIAESLRTEVDNRDLRASYFASIHQYHELYLDVLMRQDKIHPRKGLAAAAFEASERARARSLLDSLAEARVDLRKGVDGDLLKREQAVLQAFDKWAERQRQVTGSASRGSDARALATEYRNLEDRHGQVQARDTKQESALRGPCTAKTAHA